MSRWVLVGHSLGGKVAMVTTLTHPDLVRSLVVVDIAPKDYGDLDRFVGYIDAMRSLPLDELTGRADAEERFAAAESDPGVRGFLLQNLRRSGDRWSWQANLELFAADAARGRESRIADFPATGAPPVGRSRRVARRRRLRLRARRGRPGDAGAVPADPARHRQGRRPLGALRGARGRHRDAAAGRAGGRRRGADG